MEFVSENKTSIINLSYADFAHRVVKIKLTGYNGIFDNKIPIC